MSTDQAPLRVVLDGDDVGVLGFGRDGQGDPDAAQLYIVDRHGRMATIVLTPDVLDGLTAWLVDVREARTGSPRTPPPLPSKSPAPRSATSRFMGAATGWTLMDQWWDRTSGRTRAIVVGVVALTVVVVGVLAGR